MRAGDGGAAGVFFTHPGLAISVMHAFVDEIVLTAPGDDQATLGMLNALGLRGRVKLREGVLQIRVAVTPTALPSARTSSRPSRGSSSFRWRWPTSSSRAS